jgi:hypothetical protein
LGTNNRGLPGVSAGSSSSLRSAGLKSLGADPRQVDSVDHLKTER